MNKAKITKEDSIKAATISSKIEWYRWTKNKKYLEKAKKIANS